MNRNSVKFHNLLTLAVLCAAGSLFALETNSFSIDLRDECLLSGTVRVAPSSANASAVPMVDGEEMSGWTTDAPEWDTSTVADGWHTLSIAGESATPKMLTVNDEGVVVHEGVLQSDEVWAADKIHVVRDWVRIPEGRRLAIANGTVVKFCQGAGILNDGVLSSLSAVLTAVEDDSVGGDTNLDGSDSAPAPGSLAIRNEGTLNAIDNTLRHATSDSVFTSTSISEGAFFGCDELTEVVIPSNVVSIDENAFGDCKNIKRMVFQGKWTAVAQNAFDGCDAVETINFAGGLPATEFPVGQSNPTVYVNDSVSETWSGYPVVDLYSSGILERTLLIPTDEGLVGQVLTVTEEGYDWQDLPVDAELDAESANAVQNRAVVAVLNELKEADEALAEDVIDLKNHATALENADIAMQEDIAALQTKTAELASADDGMKARIDGLAATNTALLGNITVLRNADTALQGSIDLLNTAKETMEGSIATLQKTVEGLIGIPSEGGDEPGQVLTKTEEGIEWKTINVTVDAELDADSENSVQNKAVAAAVNALKAADENLGSEISALSGNLEAQTKLLRDADDAQKNATSALQESVAAAVNELKAADENLGSEISALSGNLEAQTKLLWDADDAQKNATSALQEASESTQKAVTDLLASVESLQADMGTAKADVGTLQTENGAQQNAIAALQAENQALRSDVDELNRKVATLLEILESGAGKQEVVALELEAGWNLVAMPGQVVVSESEKAMLDQIEIYTFDKTQKVYVHSEGLEPLASYWMKAPEKCTIHFIVGGK